MTTIPERDNAGLQPGEVGKAKKSKCKYSPRSIERKPPALTGQCAAVYNLIRQHQPLMSFVLTAEYAIPEAAARVHNLRAKGFNVMTTILPEVEFRGVIRRNVALYSLGSPEWPRPGYFDSESAKREPGDMSLEKAA